MKQILKDLGVNQVLVQNKKMKKSSQDGTVIFNWTLPAFKSQDGTITCPNASKCVVGCYAKQGAYIWDNVSKAHNAKLDLARHEMFVPIMIQTIETKLKNKRNKQILIRIHDAGDFFSIEYTYKWLSIMKHFQNETRVMFYAYTKQVEMFKKQVVSIPDNFKLIYSFGGKQDSQIDTENDRHALVFESETDLIARGYIDASDNDTLALTDNPKVGLVYHGTKSYNKTTWNKVKESQNETSPVVQDDTKKVA